MPADIHLISSRPREYRTLKDSIADLSDAIQIEDDLEQAMKTWNYCKWFEQEAIRLQDLAAKRCSELLNKEQS